jgi:hypothetical protein|tara:strand:+ start:10309 stop:12522 length:2214 start_codon:yes stop_codon:yes gene_type:complete
MDNPFPAYQGTEPYVFVSYAHEDSDVVFPEIQWLKDQGFNIWYDEGISPGSEWRTELADSIEACSLFLYFITPTSVVSEHCQREVNYALDQKKQLLDVHLEVTDMPSGMGMSLSSIQAIMRYELSELDYRIKLLKGTSDYIRRGVAEPTATRIVGVSQKMAIYIGLVAFSAGIILAAVTRLAVPEMPQADRAVTKILMDISPVDSLLSPEVAIAPDGREIVFSGDDGSGPRIFKLSLKNLHASPVRGTSLQALERSAIGLSLDGKSLTFKGLDKRLMKVRLDGGMPSAIANIDHFTSTAWNRNGVIVTGGRDGLFQVTSSEREAEQLTHTAPNESHTGPQFLPGDDKLLFSITHWAGTDQDEIAVLSMDSGDVRTLTAGAYPRLTASGHLLLLRGDTLFAAAFDSAKGVLLGEAVPVIEGIFRSPASYAISDEATLIYWMRAERSPSELVWVDHDGIEEPISAPPRNFAAPRISPDGTQIAITESGAVWIYTLSRQSLSKFTADGDGQYMHEWHPDGNQIVFTGLTGNGRFSNLFLKSVSGARPATQLTFDENRQFPTSWSTDGTFFFFYQFATGRPGYDLGIVHLENEPRVEIALENRFEKWHPSVSPDGRWLAYASNDTGTDEIYVRAFPDVNKSVVQITTDGGGYPKWSPDGKTLFYMSQTHMMAVTIGDTNDLEPGRPRPLFELGKYQHGIERSFDISADGRFLMLKPLSKSRPKLVWVQNWFDELERLVPRK